MEAGAFGEAAEGEEGDVTYEYVLMDVVSPLWKRAARRDELQVSFDDDGKFTLVVPAEDASGQRVQVTGMSAEPCGTLMSFTLPPLRQGALQKQEQDDGDVPEFECLVARRATLEEQLNAVDFLRVDRVVLPGEDQTAKSKKRKRKRKDDDDDDDDDDSDNSSEDGTDDDDADEKKKKKKKRRKSRKKDRKQKKKKKEKKKKTKKKKKTHKSSSSS